MKTDFPEHQKPKINLKQHQRFKRVVPWALIRKTVVALAMAGLIYYLFQNLPQRSSTENEEKGITVDIENS